MSRDNIGPNAQVVGWVTLYPDSRVLDHALVSAGANRPVNVRGSTISGSACVQNCHVIDSLICDTVVLWNGFIGVSVLCGDVTISSSVTFLIEELYWWINVP